MEKSRGSRAVPQRCVSSPPASSSSVSCIDNLVIISDDESPETTAHDLLNLSSTQVEGNVTNSAFGGDISDTKVGHVDGVLRPVPELPLDIRLAPSVTTFKKKLKTSLLQDTLVDPRWDYECMGRNKTSIRHKISFQEKSNSTDLTKTYHEPCST
ncbi:hypothetical protein AMELA_G00296790 [Ameiurus melas]|uniref:Uncharacterized protein n=1 Tax=Ameiurus melas TaxID=219545 RepID=A0A7J5ZHN8_AMEME|nr:hypothetical protein AMELA_G00296790 [Ameiurus melas]